MAKQGTILLGGREVGLPKPQGTIAKYNASKTSVTVSAFNQLTLVANAIGSIISGSFSLPKPGFLRAYKISSGWNVGGLGAQKGIAFIYGDLLGGAPFWRPNVGSFGGTGSFNNFVTITKGGSQSEVERYYGENELFFTPNNTVTFNVVGHEAAAVIGDTMTAWVNIVFDLL